MTVAARVYRLWSLWLLQEPRFFNGKNILYERAGFLDFFSDRFFIMS